MKKTYMMPAISVERAEQEVELMSGSVASNNGIGYGGVDTEGDMDPDARDYDFDVWED